MNAPEIRNGPDAGVRAGWPGPGATVPLMPATPTEPGWYPDPWGTDGERRFDGTAWSRETRPGPGAPAPEASGATTGASGAGPLPPAAWYPDPAGSGGLRYWDGAAWTAHTAYTSPADRPGPVAPRLGVDAVVLLASERSFGRVARALLLLAGPALAAYVASTIVALHAIGPQWRDAMADPSQPFRFEPIDIPGYLNTISNLASLVLVVTGVVFIMWLGRAGKVALAAGRPLRRSPWLGAWSFAIPVLHWWWPYRATRDLIGGTAGDVRLITRWWTLWIVATTSQIAIGALALLGAPPVVTAAVTAIVGVVAIVAAVAARAVIAAVGRDHAALVDAPAQA